MGADQPSSLKEQTKNANPSEQTPPHQNQAQRPQQATYEPPTVFEILIGQNLNKTADYCGSEARSAAEKWRQHYVCEIHITDAVQADIAIALAAFTFVLMVVGIGQLFAIQQQSTIAARALTDLERPHLFVVVKPSLVAQRNEGGHDQAGAGFIFANYGRFPATIKACHCFIGASEEAPREGKLSKQVSTFIGPDKTADGKTEWLPDDHPVRFHEDDHGEIDGATIWAEAETETFFRIDVNYTGPGDMEYVSTFIWRWDCERNCWFSVESRRT